MALNYFIGLSVEQLEAALKLAQGDLLAGASIESAGSGDVSSRNKTELSPQTRIAMILSVLNTLDPGKYPAEQTKRTTQTRITFDQNRPWPNQVTNL